MRPGGSACHFAKLTEAEVAQIHVALAAGERQVDIAARYGVSQTAISRIKIGKAWNADRTVIPAA